MPGMIKSVMDIHTSDIMLLIDDHFNSKEQSIFESKMREQTGVIGLSYHGTPPHLMFVEYDLDVTTPKDLLHAVNKFGLHAELIGFL